MNEIKKILFATDFSDVSRNAEDRLSGLMDKLGGRLEIVHVFDPDEFNIPGPYYFMAGLEKWLTDHYDAVRQRSKKALDELCRKFGDVPGHFEEGQPGKQIVALAKRLNSDLIVMGTHGHKGWNHFLLGSVAEYVIRRAPCDLWAIKPRVQAEPAGDSP